MNQRTFSRRHILRVLPGGALLIALGAAGGPASPAAARPVPAWTVRAAVALAVAAPGRVQTITATVACSRATTALVNIEVRDGAGARVHGRAYDNQAFTRNVARAFSSAWSIPDGTPTGDYTVAVQVYTSAWGRLLYTVDAARFVITAPLALPLAPGALLFLITQAGAGTID